MNQMLGSRYELLQMLDEKRVRELLRNVVSLHELSQQNTGQLAHGYGAQQIKATLSMSAYHFKVMEQDTVRLTETFTYINLACCRYLSDYQFTR